MNTSVYLVMWTQDASQCCEVFAEEDVARRWVNARNLTGARIVTVAVRGVEYL